MFLANKTLGGVCILSAALTTAQPAIDTTSAQNNTSMEGMTIAPSLDVVGKRIMEGMRTDLHPLLQTNELGLSVEEEPKVEVTSEELQPHGQAIVDGARLRKCANTESTILTLLYKGMIFDVLDKEANFFKVKCDGIVGYIEEELIVQYTDKAPYPLYVKPEKPKKVKVRNKNTVKKSAVQANTKARKTSVKVQKDGRPHFNPNNLRELSNLSEKQIYNMLEGTALQKLAGSYYAYERKYGVNAIFLASLNSLESGYGRSSLAVNNRNIGGVKSGSGGWRHFSSWDACLDYIANLIDSKYLTKGGAYYSGPSIWDVNKRYCEETDWSSKINHIAGKYISKLK